MDRAAGGGVFPAGRPREGARAERVAAVRPKRDGGARLAGGLHQLHRVANDAASCRNGRTHHSPADQVRAHSVPPPSSIVPSSDRQPATHDSPSET